MADEIVSGNLYVDGNVSIGTENTNVRLEVNSGCPDGSPVMGVATLGADEWLALSCSNQVDADSHIFWKQGALRFGLSSNLEGEGFSGKLSITEPGNVGIGTSDPSERLEVRGNIKLGSKLDLYAVGGLQNMRMVAGQIGSNGEIKAGQGYSIPGGPVSKKDHASYTVRFSEPFLHPPIVVVTASDPAKWEDNIANAYRIRAHQFEVSITDGGRPENKGETSEFNFIAIGLA